MREKGQSLLTYVDMVAVIHVQGITTFLTRYCYLCVGGIKELVLRRSEYKVIWPFRVFYTFSLSLESTSLTGKLVEHLSEAQTHSDIPLTHVYILGNTYTLVKVWDAA